MPEKARTREPLASQDDTEVTAGIYVRVKAGSKFTLKGLLKAF